MTHVLIFFTIWTIGWLLIALHCYREWKKTLPSDDEPPADLLGPPDQSNDPTEQSEVQ